MPALRHSSLTRRPGWPPSPRWPARVAPGPGWDDSAHGARADRVELGEDGFKGLGASSVTTGPFSSPEDGPRKGPPSEWAGTLARRGQGRASCSRGRPAFRRAVQLLLAILGFQGIAAQESIADADGEDDGGTNFRRLWKLYTAVAVTAIFNVMMSLWKDTSNVVERRRSDVLAIQIWILLLGFNVWVGVEGAENDHWTLEEWTALALPWILALPNIAETTTALLQHIEMWHWLERSARETMPLGWLMRTMTTTEKDEDGDWLRLRQWQTSARRVFAVVIPGSQRTNTVFKLMKEWHAILRSGIQYQLMNMKMAFLANQFFRVLQAIVLWAVAVVALLVQGTIWLLTVPEDFLMWLSDYHRQVQDSLWSTVYLKYDALHLNRIEVQRAFVLSKELKSSMTHEHGVQNTPIRRRRRRRDALTGYRRDFGFLGKHDRIMGAVLTTIGAFENSFRKAYLVQPFYKVPWHSRKVLRPEYEAAGVKVDQLIKGVRQVLELKNTAGLLSVSSDEAVLHDYIEATLSTAIYYPTVVVYQIACYVAKQEHESEEAAENRDTDENATAMRVVYIDTRQFLYLLLWWEIVRNKPMFRQSLEEAEDDEMDVAGAEAWIEDHDIHLPTLVVAAFVMSRIRYIHRYRPSEHDPHHPGYARLGTTVGRRGLQEYLRSLDGLMANNIGMRLNDWIQRTQPGGADITVDLDAMQIGYQGQTYDLAPAPSMQRSATWPP